MAVQLAQGQNNNKQKAMEMAREAVKLMDNGKLDESIQLLEEALKIDPDNMNYTYELAYAYYVKNEYHKSQELLESILSHPDANDRVYQMLGNTYDNLGDENKAIETYKSGLKLFPKSGNLYLEMGVMQMKKKEYNEALSYFENGIKVAPAFSSNYYWATIIYCNSTEEVWGMIYGEIFMNLERNTKRTAEISKVLFDTYKSEIKFKDENEYSVSFCKNASINIGSKKDLRNLKLPFGIGVYEPTLLLSMLSVDSIDIHSLNKVRSAFVDNYFNKGHDKSYPNVLFSYQKKVKKAGHMEAYNYWILMKGDEDGFAKWQTENIDKWKDFLNWFKNNGLKINESNKFHSSQY